MIQTVSERCSTKDIEMLTKRIKILQEPFIQLSSYHDQYHLGLVDVRETPNNIRICCYGIRGYYTEVEARLKNFQSMKPAEIETRTKAMQLLKSGEIEGRWASSCPATTPLRVKYVHVFNSSIADVQDLVTLLQTHEDVRTEAEALGIDHHDVNIRPLRTQITRERERLNEVNVLRERCEKNQTLRDAAAKTTSENLSSVQEQSSMIDSMELTTTFGSQDITANRDTSLTAEEMMAVVADNLAYVVLSSPLKRGVITTIAQAMFGPKSHNGKHRSRKMLETEVQKRQALYDSFVASETKNDGNRDGRFVGVFFIVCFDLSYCD